jgi:hypothetical protein
MQCIQVFLVILWINEQLLLVVVMVNTTYFSMVCTPSPLTVFKCGGLMWQISEGQKEQFVLMSGDRFVQNSVAKNFQYVSDSLMKSAGKKCLQNKQERIKNLN